MTQTKRADRRLLLHGAAAGMATMAWGASDAASSGKDLYVIAEIVGKPEKADELRKIIVPFAAKAAKEPGCREYKLMEVESEPGRFLTFERWSSHEALDAHMKTPAMAAIGPKLGDLLGKPFTQIFLRDPQAK